MADLQLKSAIYNLKSAILKDLSHGCPRSPKDGAHESVFALLGGLPGGPQADAEELDLSRLGAGFTRSGRRLSLVSLWRQAGRWVRPAGAGDDQRPHALGGFRQRHAHHRAHG